VPNYEVAYSRTARSYQQLEGLLRAQETGEELEKTVGLHSCCWQFCLALVLLMLLGKGSCWTGTSSPPLPLFLALHLMAGFSMVLVAMCWFVVAQVQR